MNNKVIPLSVPNVNGNEWKYVKDCLDTGWISSAGSYVTQFEQMVADYAGAKNGVAVVNGTNALYICMLLKGVRQHDLVIIPNITFVATPNSIAYLGASPVLIDVDPRTWQMDLDMLESFLTEHTEIREGECFHTATQRRIPAIMPVHVLGNIGDMDRLLALAQEFHLDVIEDSTEALGSTYKKKSAGLFGEMGVFSFNGNKIISTGGGGVIVTDNDQLAEKAKHLTTQAKPIADQYYHDEVGYNYRMVNILAAVGVAQMEQLPGFIQRKLEIIEAYERNLSGVGDIQFQKILPEVTPNGWLFTIQTERKNELLKYLNEQKIISRSFWIPMNQLPMYKDCIYHTKDDQSNHIFNTCLSIPSSTNLTDIDLEIVSAGIKSFFNSDK